MTEPRGPVVAPGDTVEGRYRVIKPLDEGGMGELLLFVVPSPGATVDDAVLGRLRSALRTECSPRHVPDEILEVPEVPYTISGKKMEAPVKRILSGVAPSEAANRDTMRNPESLDYFASLTL